MLTSPALVRSSFLLSARSCALGCVGQPTWVQRLERIVKLGSVPSRPLFLMYAARRELTPAAGSERNRATTNSPSGKASSGPTSTRFCF